MQAFIIIAILGVAVLGAAGAYPGIFPACAITAALGLLTANPVQNRQNRWVWLTGTLILGWVLFTVVPLPSFVMSRLAPVRQEYFLRADKALAQLDAIRNLPPAAVRPAFDASPLADGLPPAAGGATAGDNATSQPLPASGSHGLSLNQHGTLRFFLLIAGCWGLFWMSASLAATVRRRLLKALVIGGATVAAIGITGRYSGWITQILPWQLMDEFGNTGSIWPFVNRDHFATFAAMLAPAALCLTLSPSLDMSAAQKPTNSTRRLSWLLPATALARIFYLSLFVLLVGATLFSQSRGGTVALLLSLILTIMYWLRGRQSGGSTIATILGIGVLLGVVFMPSAPFQQRMDTLHVDHIVKENQGRIEIWSECMDAWKDLPALGAGMEGLRTLQPIHKTTPSLAEAGYAHNEYIQILTDGGVLGAILFGMFGFFYLHAFAAYRFTPKPYIPEAREESSGEESRVRPLRAIVVGAGAVVVFHSFFDFPCRIPLNAFLLAAILGMGLSRKIMRSGTPLRWRYAAAVVSTALLGATLFTVVSIGDRTCHYDYAPFLQQAPVRTLAAAVSRTPAYWRGWNELGARSYNIATGRANADAAFATDPAADRPWWQPWLSDRPAVVETSTTTLPPERKTGDALEEVGRNVRPHASRLAASPQMHFQIPPGTARAWMDFSLECFRTAAVYNPCNYLVWETLGNVEGAAGNLENAQAAFDRMVELAPYMKPAADKSMREFSRAASLRP